MSTTGIDSVRGTELLDEQTNLLNAIDRAKAEVDAGNVSRRDYVAFRRRSLTEIDRLHAEWLALKGEHPVAPEEPMPPMTPLKQTTSLAN